jgi:hypothetical protein
MPDTLGALKKTIKVGPHTWNINVSEMGEDKPETWGLTDSNTLTITIDSRVPSSAFAVGVMIHELYHAMLYSFGVKQPKKEEAAAQFVESAFTTVFQDNPWLMTWIKKGLKNG